MKWFAGLLLALSSLPCSAQAIEEYFLNATVLIKHPVDAEHFSQGSGFLILREISKDEVKHTSSYEIVLITNKHVLPLEQSGHSQITVKIAVRNGDAVDTKELSINILGPDGKFLKNVAMNPNPRVDVAAVNITHEMSKEDTQYMRRAKETGKAFILDALLPVKKFKESGVVIGSDVYLLGYPNGFSDPRNVSPILRVGIISTEPDKDYSFGQAFSDVANLPVPIPGFLIDANVYPGSSGSMVIRKPTRVTGFHSGSVMDVQYVLGIVADSIPMHDSGLNIDERMGLGVVFNSDTIFETIDLLPKNSN